MKTKGIVILMPLVAMALLIPIGCMSVDDSTSSGGTSIAGDESADASSARDASAEDAESERIDATPTRAPEEREAPSAATLRSAESTTRTSPGFVYESVPTESGLSAGLADDNRQYGYFLGFLDEYRWAGHIDLDVSERIVFEVTDSAGESVPNAAISISGGGGLLESGKTHADGSYQFNPSLYDASLERYDVEIESTAGSRRLTIDRDGSRRISIAFAAPRVLPQTIPLDLVFVLDTTGSMGEEIERLKLTIELIHLNLTNLAIPTSVRFGMVLYKDLGDEYRTELVELTDDLDLFQSRLEEVRASGGGDTPEDLQAALEETVTAMSWREEGLRLAFIITDAPPHLDYDQSYDYTDASKDARRQALKIFSVGTGGLDIHGEYVLRQIAQFTGGAYIFLTYGEQGESEGGAPGSVSHHTGTNYQTDKLETIIIRLAKEELSHLTQSPIAPPEPYFTARRIDSEERERTLSTLFSRAIEQLADFSTLALPEDLPTAVLPFIAVDEANTADAEYFTEQLILAASRSDRIALVERQNLPQLLEEQKIQLSGLTDSETVIRVGELVNAEALVVGSLFAGERYELFLRLLRVETGEVLSVTKARIDPRLGISGGR